MGMTPAVSLTSQSLDPVQAYAATADGWTVSGSISGTTGAPTYTGQNQTVTVSVAGTDGATVDSGWTLTSVTGPDSKETTFDAAQKTFVANAAGTYTITIKADDDSSTKTGSFILAKATVEADGPSSVQVADLSALNETEALKLVAGKITVGDLAQGTADNQFSVAYKSADVDKKEITYTITLHGGNYTFAGDLSTYDLVVSAADAPSGETTDITSSMIVSFGPSQTGYTGSEIKPSTTVTATIGDEQGAVIPAASVTTTWEPGQGVELVDGKIVNAGVYNATVEVSYTVDGVTYTGTKEVENALTVNPASISVQYIAFANKQVASGATVSIPNSENAETYIPAQIAVKSSATDAALTANTDYQVAVNAAAKTFTVSGLGNYAGSVAYKYTLTYALADVTVSNPADKDGVFTYNTAAQTPKVEVKDPSDQAGKAVLTEGTDYTVTYQQNGKDIAASAIVDAGTYSVVVKAVEGSGFTGEATATFEVMPFTLTDKNTTVSGLDNLTYTGEEIAQPKDLAVTANVNGKSVSLALTGDKADATVEWPTDVIAVNAADDPYELTVTGQGNYSTDAPLAFEFSVVGAAITADDITVDYDGPDADEATYALLQSNGSGVNVADFISVKVGETELTNGDDYTLSIAGVTGTTVTEPGVVPVVVEGKGNYSGKQTVQVDIRRNIEDAILTPLPTDLQWTGEPIKPAVDLNYQGQHLVEETDYTVEYVNNTNAGVDTASVVITGTGTKWGGTAKYDFSIHGEKAFLSDVKAEAVTYNGSEQTPKITFTLKDAAGKVISGVNPVIIPQGNDSYVDANTYSIKVAVEGKYEVDPAVIDFVINPADLSKMEVTPVYPEGTDAYLVGGDVKEVTPTFQTVLDGKTVTLTSNDIETVAPIKASGDVTVTGQGNYTKSAKVAVKVLTSIDTVVVSEIEPVVYNGEAQTPEFKVYASATDQENDQELPAASEDGKTEYYTVSWVNNINAGTAQLVLTGKGIYGGTKIIDFTIEKAAATLEFNALTETYTGSALKPEPVVTLKSEVAELTSDKDFTATYGYTNNINAGTATITVNASGEAANNYAFETVTKDWTIEAAAISGATYTGDTTVKVGKQPAVSFTFNGKTLVKDVDYKVVATPIVDKEGKATLTVEGIGNFKGTKTVTITVSNSATPGKPDQPTTTTPGWKSNATGWWYVDANGSYPTNTWKAIGGAWYHFDAAGYMSTGWVNDNGTWYYCNKAGEGVEGKMAQGWKYIDGRWFYFAANGAMATGWLNVGGTYYLMNTQHDGTYGAMLVGWQKVDHATGAPTTANSWYYLNPVGGALATNTWVGNYHVDSTGYWNYSR